MSLVLVAPPVSAVTAAAAVVKSPRLRFFGQNVGGGADGPEVNGISKAPATTFGGVSSVPVDTSDSSALAVGAGNGINARCCTPTT
ncbi:hypothetical protein ACFJIX_26870 [Roseateles sp. UC29_93]|uniref:hypothetical protein n=1 Tax=Roseateles sp. UC29_93 TaxID=3350177 RepID=UPI00366BEFEC